MKQTILLFSFPLVFFLTGMLSAGATTVISDPVGDGLFVDLIQVTGGYDDENVYFSASFSPGNFQTENLGFFFYLNTDMDANTGSSGLGIDYTLMFHQPTGTSFPPVGLSPAVAVFDTVNSTFTGRSPIEFATDFSPPPYHSPCLAVMMEKCSSHSLWENRHLQALVEE